MDQRLAMFEEITSAPGVPGFEGPVRKVIRKHLEGLAEISEDGIGSIICRKAGSTPSPRIMLAGHMDEIGFMVTLITKEGFLKFQTLGGWWQQVMLAQRVMVKTHKGDVPGVIGSKPPHILTDEERKKVVERADVFIDVGASSADEARDFGIRPGDPVVPVTEFTVMANPKLLMAKAWDCRVGCALFIDTIRALHGEDHPNTVYGVGTVQEEVGLRGAATSVELVDPDVGFALEVGIAGDMPGVKETEAQEKLGRGPVILLYDSSMVPHTGLRDFVVSTAEAVGIPYQYDAMARGGTDAGRIHLHRSGVPSLVLGVPTRYIHSHAGIINRDDYDNALKLLLAVIQRLDADTASALRAS